MRDCAGVLLGIWHVVYDLLLRLDHFKAICRPFLVLVGQVDALSRSEMLLGFVLADVSFAVLALRHELAVL